MNAEIRSPSDIHDFFKSIRRNMEFFRLPSLEAFLHSFRVLEVLQLPRLVLSVASGDLEGLKISVQSYADIKKYLIYWIYAECPEGGRSVPTKESDINMAISAIELALEYSKIHDMIVAVQNNKATLTIDSTKKRFAFNYTDPAKGALFVRKFEESIRGEAELLAGLKNGESISEFDDALNQLEDSVRVTKDGNLKYCTNEFMLKAFEKQIKLLLGKQSVLPDNWSLRAYKIGNFRDIWVQLCILSHIRVLALLMGINKSAQVDVIINNSLININKRILINYLVKHTKLKRDVIEDIFRDLIYDLRLSHMDVMYQPLLEIISNEIYFSPHLVLDSRIDRNLQVLLTKLPYRQNEYSELKNLKELNMIERISLVLKRSGFSFRPSIALKEKGQVVTDVDILIWDSNHEDFLVTQLKWFYGADSTQEMLNHDDQFNEGIKKTKIAIDHLRSNSDRIRSLIGISAHEDIKNIFGCIVSKLGTPSPFIEDSSFPVIEESDFNRLIEKSNGKVIDLYRPILSLCSARNSVPKYKMSQIEIKVEEITFILPGVELS